MKRDIILSWTSITFISVYDVKKALQDKWSSAGDLFSPSSNLLLNDKAIVSYLERTLNSASDGILGRGNKANREKFLKNSGNLFNILRCK